VTDDVLLERLSLLGPRSAGPPRLFRARQGPILEKILPDRAASVKIRRTVTPQNVRATAR